MNRTRTSPAIVSYGLYLYFSSRSFRLAAKCLSSYIKRSHVAIWKWVQKYSDCADRFLRTDKRLVRVIFVDETLLQIDGKDHWLWIAYEPYLSSCLMMHLSRERTIFVCYQFFKQLRCRYGRRPIFTDGAQWYNNASADGSDWSTICMVLSWRTLWKGSSSISRTERNVSMTKNGMFRWPFSLQEKRELWQTACLELAEVICIVLAYWNGQDVIHGVLGKRRRLS